MREDGGGEGVGTEQETSEEAAAVRPMASVVTGPTSERALPVV